MSLFNTQSTPIFLKEESTTAEQIARLKELQEKATGKVKDDIAREINLASYGEIGEKNIAFELKNAGMPMYIIHDLHLQFEDLTAQIDYVVVTRKLIFFIECKNLYGNIEIDNQGNFVRSYPWNGRTIKEGIYSPITQNQRHLEVYKQLNRSNKKSLVMRIGFDKCFDKFHKSIVVLANPKTILNAKYAKKEVKDQVIRADQLIAFIKNAEKQSKELASSEKGMKELANGILGYHTPIPTDYTQKYEERIANQAETSVKQAPAAPIIVEKPPAPVPVLETAVPPLPQNDELVSKLKDFRLKQSRAENTKAYCVFTDKQMQDLLSKMPKTTDELLGVTGFGPVKVEKYGVAIIDLLNAGMRLS
ncbi:NERD domain-containing protein [Acetobacterium woodii]|uniref:HRDC domain-containing protein n=1 Tax=Acetobacterium woodii (strain ATCC 29683 / DSM 1030 / JCM 2381 / KCTC 1655 / WB1) TaxID=931626 RepID=H6LJ77_ACEWD|nr:NERD domain-containing protein [Acetobacterium woodii]AFA48640.1 hypothetical protein Awo_c18610 [Acetobacterium woodii DSM 1030]